MPNLKIHFKQFSVNKVVSQSYLEINFRGHKMGLVNPNMNQ